MFCMTQKPVNWFAMQINCVVSIRWETLIINRLVNDVQINRWFYLLRSFWGIPLRSDLWKRIDPKYFLFIGTNNWIVLAVRWIVKYFFASNSPIFWIRLAEKREEGQEKLRQLQSVRRFTETQQEVSDDLSICVFNTLPKVGSLPSWLAINLVKVEI